MPGRRLPLPTPATGAGSRRAAHASRAAPARARAGADFTDASTPSRQAARTNRAASAKRIARSAATSVQPTFPCLRRRRRSPEFQTLSGRYGARRGQLSALASRSGPTARRAVSFPQVALLLSFAPGGRIRRTCPQGADDRKQRIELLRHKCTNASIGERGHAP